MSAKVTTLKSASRFQRQTNPFQSRLIATFIVIVMVSQSTGCTFQGPIIDPVDVFEMQLTDYRDMVWAKRAFNLRYGNCDREYGDHFRRGFEDGYREVCEGESGYVPAMPPEHYWGAEYQCADGAQCVNAWFKGFPVGAQAAKRDGAGSYRNVYISKMINSAITQQKQAAKVPYKIPETVPGKVSKKEVPSAPPAANPPVPPVIKPPAGSQTSSSSVPTGSLQPLPVYAATQATNHEPVFGPDEPN